jgi:hypothetical protein
MMGKKDEDRIEELANLQRQGSCRPVDQGL